jgi:hypothetical protein
MSSNNQPQTSLPDAQMQKPEGDEATDATETFSKMSEAEIDYNVMGSFPASDPPSWTLGIRINKQPSDDFEGEKPSANDPSHQNETL